MPRESGGMERWELVDCGILRGDCDRVHRAHEVIFERIWFTKRSQSCSRGGCVVSKTMGSRDGWNRMMKRFWRGWREQETALDGVSRMSFVNKKCVLITKSSSRRILTSGPPANLL